MKKLFDIRLTFTDFSSKKFLNMEPKDVGVLIDDIATKDEVKIKRKTYLTIDIANFEIFNKTKI